MTVKAVVRLNDISSHGGHIITASSDVTVNGIGIACDQDLHQCPLFGHGTTPVTATSGITFVNNRAVVRTGDVARCGAVMITGSPNEFAG